MFFLDTNIFVYAATESPYRDGATAVVEALGEDAVGATTSAAVIEELWHLELSGRVPGLSGVTDAAFTLVRPVLSVTDDIVAAALVAELPRSLGANDRIHVATCRANTIDTILTADQGFEHTPRLRWVDLADLPAVQALISS